MNQRTLKKCRGVKASILLKGWLDYRNLFGSTFSLINNDAAFPDFQTMSVQIPEFLEGGSY